MKRALRGAAVLVILATAVLRTPPAYGQSLRADLQDVFDEVLKPTDQGGSLVLTGPSGAHGRHFIPSSVEASAATITAFGNFLSESISSFPLTSTAAGVTFDFSSGMPVATATSLGPVFGERAQTQGRHRLRVGLNVSYLNLERLRGVDTKDIRFTFFHDDVAGPGQTAPNFTPDGIIGDDPSGNELDNIDLYVHMDLNATVAALFASYGITDRLDVSAAIPYIALSMNADPVARMNPLSVLSRGYQTADTVVVAGPTHYWGSPEAPLLTFYPREVRDDAVGIGDVALRLKYNLLRMRAADAAALLEWRPPTGSRSDFLGAGSHSLRGQLVLSSIQGDFAPHLNLGYSRRGSGPERDQVEVCAGYDQKARSNVTLALDFLGQFQVHGRKASSDFPQSTRVQGSGPWTNFTEVVQLTNIPTRSRDSNLNASFGMRMQPKEDLVVVGNVLFPLNDGGFRSNAITTLGLEMAF